MGEIDMKLLVNGIPTAFVRGLRGGGLDANGQAPVVRVAEGTGNPCRHCLGLIAPGEDKLVLSYRPFPVAQPYAETGPIFLHARDCAHYEGDQLPFWFSYLQPAIVRGYDRNDWIVYETGDVVEGSELEQHCQRILEREDIAYVHIRSKFNCFQCKVERG